MFIGYFKMKINLKNIILHSKKLNMISNRFYDKKLGKQTMLACIVFWKKKVDYMLGLLCIFLY